MDPLGLYQRVFLSHRMRLWLNNSHYNDLKRLITRKSFTAKKSLNPDSNFYGKLKEYENFCT